MTRLKKHTKIPLLGTGEKEGKERGRQDVESELWAKGHPRPGPAWLVEGRTPKQWLFGSSSVGDKDFLKLLPRFEENFIEGECQVFANLS